MQFKARCNVANYMAKKVKEKLNKHTGVETNKNKVYVMIGDKWYNKIVKDTKSDSVINELEWLMIKNKADINIIKVGKI